MRLDRQPWEWAREAGGGGGSWVCGVRGQREELISRCEELVWRQRTRAGKMSTITAALCDSAFNAYTTTCLERPPHIGHKSVVCQDRWSLVTGSVILKYRSFCRKCVYCKTGGLSWQRSLNAGFTVSFFESA